MKLFLVKVYRVLEHIGRERAARHLSIMGYPHYAKNLLDKNS